MTINSGRYRDRDPCEELWVPTLRAYQRLLLASLCSGLCSSSEFVSVDLVESIETCFQTQFQSESVKSVVSSMISLSRSGGSRVVDRMDHGIAAWHEEESWRLAQYHRDRSIDLTPAQIALAEKMAREIEGNTAARVRQSTVDGLLAPHCSDVLSPQTWGHVLRFDQRVPRNESDQYLDRVRKIDISHGRPNLYKGPGLNHDANMRPEVEFAWHCDRYKQNQCMVGYYNASAIEPQLATLHYGVTANIE